MSFFDDVIKTGKDVVSAAGKKTDSAVKLSKLKIRETQIQNDIRGKYEKLGEFIYQASKSGEKDEAALADQIKALNELFTELEDISKQNDELRNIVTCPECGTKHKDDDTFCSKCGAKLPEKPKPEEAPAEDNSDENK